MACRSLAGGRFSALSSPVAIAARPLSGARRGLAAAASPKAPVLRRRRPKPPKKKERSELAGTQLVSAYVMASTHRPVELAQLLREKFGPAAVRYMGDGDEAAGGAGGGDSCREGRSGAHTRASRSWYRLATMPLIQLEWISTGPPRGC